MDKKQAQKYVKGLQRLVDKVQPGGSVSVMRIGKAGSAILIKYSDPGKASILPIRFWDDMQEAVEGNMSIVRLQSDSVVLEFSDVTNADAMNKLGRLAPSDASSEESAKD